MGLTRGILVLALLHSNLCYDEFSGICEKIFFKQPVKGYELAYKGFINSVFVRTNITADGFPVYKDERNLIYFQYSKAQNKFYFSRRSTGVKNYAGLAMEGNRWYMGKSAEWLVRHFRNKVEDLFAIVGGKWLQFRPDIKSNAYLVSRIIGKCVNLTTCTNNDVVFIQKSVDGKMFVDEFFFMRNVSLEARTVYVHQTGKIYLYFYNNMWNIGNNYLSSRVIYYVNDQALRPEFITSPWKKWTGKQWQTLNFVQVQCAGTNETEDCSPGRCLNGGVCSLNARNFSVCTCRYQGLQGYQGSRCEQKITSGCPDTGLATVTRSLGSVGVQFCTHGTFFAQQCVNKDFSLVWKQFGTCVLPTTRRPTRRWTKWKPVTYWTDAPTTSKPFNANDYPYMSYVSITVMILCTIFGPLVTCLFVPKNLKKSMWRYTALHWYVAMWFLAIYLLVDFCMTLEQFGHLFVTLRYIAIGLASFFYLFSLLEACCSHESQYLSSSMEGDDIDSYFNDLFVQLPLIVVSIVCYHYETRTRVVYYTDANGNRQSRTETYTEKVVTYTGQKAFEYKAHRDVSDKTNVPRAIAGKVLRVKVSKELLYADDITKRAFESFKVDYIAANRHRDAYIDHEVSFDIPGFKPRVMAAANGQPWWMNWGYYTLAHLLALGWPYRWLIKGGSDKVNYCIQKEISMTPYERPLQYPTTLPEEYPSAPPLPGEYPQQTSGEHCYPHMVYHASTEQVTPVEPPPSYFDATGKH